MFEQTIAYIPYYPALAHTDLENMLTCTPGEAQIPTRHFREPLDLTSVQYIIPSPYLLILQHKKCWSVGHYIQKIQMFNSTPVKPKCIA